MSRDKRIDTYIEKAEDFAQPILTHLRRLVHEACPGVEETIKWGMPAFVYKTNLCGMASFKNHCAFSFWKASLMKDPHHILSTEQREGMGSLGKIRSLADLPEDPILLAYIAEAVKLNAEGRKVVRKRKSEAEMPAPPDYFINELKSNLVALKTFEDISPYHKKEYVEWITEAKTEATRQKRMATAVEWLSEGKPRNWKYMK